MSVGTGIFLSAILVSIVGLYAATKDRWNWKRIAKWGLALPVAAIAVLALGIWASSAYEERPAAQEDFEGLKLSSTPADVRFLKGEPISRHSNTDFWVYDAHSGSAETEDAVVLVRFHNGKVRYIGYWANEDQIVTPYLLGFSIGAEYGAIIEKLGQPSYVSTSPDGLSRILSFEKCRAFFELERGRVRTFGIFDPTTGPVKFSKEPSTPLPPAK